MPVLALRLSGIGAGALLSASLIGPNLWLIVALALLAGAALRPRSPAMVALIALLAIDFIVRGAHGYSWRFVVLAAGAHLLLGLAIQWVWLPWRGRIQLRALARPVRRFVIIQLSCQLASALLLEFVFPRVGGGDVAVSPLLGIIGAAALLVLAVVVFVPILRRGDQL